MSGISLAPPLFSFRLVGLRHHTLDAAMDLLDCLEHTPGGVVTGAVVWLHGLGASGNDFVPLVPHLGLPTVRFVFPHAQDAPVTINNGHVMPSWYDIRSLDHARPDREDPDGVRASALRVRALIDREVARGVPHDKIVLAGFSQGAALALHTALRLPEALAGLMVLSGYLVLGDTLEAEVTAAGRAANVLFCHGSHDDVVPMTGGREAARRVAELGATTAWHDWPMAHEVSMEEIRTIRQWLANRLA